MEHSEIETDSHVHFMDPSMVLRHVVLFKFKDNASSETIRELQNKFCSLPSKIEYVYDFEWGTDVSVEGLTEGFTHCFFVSFLSEADRDAYLPHPEHKAFADSLMPHLDKVIVVDYWTRI